MKRELSVKVFAGNRCMEERTEEQQRGGEERRGVPERSLGAWDHLAWRRWGACCPLQGWVPPLRSETHKNGD